MCSLCWLEYTGLIRDKKMPSIEKQGLEEIFEFVTNCSSEIGSWRS